MECIHFIYDAVGKKMSILMMKFQVTQIPSVQGIYTKFSIFWMRVFGVNVESINANRIKLCLDCEENSIT